MCFFDQHRFACGDWKWGHFRLHCAKEYSTGETCGLKLVQQTIPVSGKCKLCQRMDVKARRRAAEIERIERWQRSGTKYRASIDKSMEQVRCLDQEIYDLQVERKRRLSGIVSSDSSNDHGTSSPSVPAPPMMDIASNSGTAAGTEYNQQFSPHKNEARNDDTPQYQGKGYHLRRICKHDGTLGVPITFESIPNPATVMAIPDTGADENVISLDLAILLGLDMELDEMNESALLMINGKTSHCSGVTRARCGFGITSHFGPSGIPCIFKISESTISSLIMSMGFLMETRTLSKYRHRLISRAKSLLRIPCIRAFGQAQYRFRCSLNGQDVEAFPDTGSDVDVMAHDYATQRGFVVKPSNAWVMFANGTMQKAVGICTLQLAAGFGIDLLPEDDISVTEEGKVEGIETGPKSSQDDAAPDQEITTDGQQVTKPGHRDVIWTHFYVLHEIAVDVLLGTESLESLQAYTLYQDQFITKASSDTASAGMNRIVLLRKIEHFLNQAASKWFGFAQEFSLPAGSRISIDQVLGDADQRENARREDARVEASRLVGQEKVEYEEQEKAKQIGYHQYRDALELALRGESRQ